MTAVVTQRHSDRKGGIEVDINLLRLRLAEILETVPVYRLLPGLLRSLAADQTPSEQQTPL